MDIKRVVYGYETSKIINELSVIAKIPKLLFLNCSNATFSSFFFAWNFSVLQMKEGVVLYAERKIFSTVSVLCYSILINFIPFTAFFFSDLTCMNRWKNRNQILTNRWTVTVRHRRRIIRNRRTVSPKKRRQTQRMHCSNGLFNQLTVVK